MLSYESIKQIKILVSKALYHILSSLAFIIVFEELFTVTFGIHDKESDFLAIHYSLGKSPTHATCENALISIPRLFLRNNI